MKRKTVVMIQGLASLALVILMAIFALLPVTQVTVYPTEETLAATNEIAALSLASKLGEDASKDELEKAGEEFADYIKKLEESAQPERDLTDEELAEALEYEAKGAAVKAKIDERKAILELRDKGNLSESAKQELLKQADDLEAEIIDDFKEIEYYESPVGAKGHEITFSLFDLIGGIQSTQLLSYTMNRNHLMARLATETNESEIKSLQQRIEDESKWLDEHKDYYKTVTPKTLDTALYFGSVTNDFRSTGLSTERISTNQAAGLYDLAFTDLSVSDSYTMQLMFGIFGLLFIGAFQIAALVIALVTLIGALTSIANRNKMYSRSIGGFRLMALIAFLPVTAVALGANTSLAVGGALFTVALVLGLLLNGLAARTLQGDKVSETYLNLTQGWGLLSFIGMLIGAFTLGAKGLFNSFYSRGALFTLAKKMSIKSVGTAFNLSFLFLICIMLAFFMLECVILRFALLDKKKFDKDTQNVKTKKGLGNRHPAGCTAVFAALLIVLFILFGVLFSLNVGGVAGCIVGLALVFIATVVYIVLSKKMCGGLGETARARLGMQAMPSDDEDPDADICIPVIGALLNKNKADGAGTENTAE